MIQPQLKPAVHDGDEPIVTESAPGNGRGLEAPPESPATGSASFANGAQGTSGRERVKIIKFSRVSKRFVLHQQRPRSFQEMITGFMGRAATWRNLRRSSRPPPESSGPCATSTSRYTPARRSA